MASTTKGKALVTGASTGIGAIYADRLARRGYDLIIVARNEKQLQELSSRLKAETGRSIELLQADLTNGTDLKRVEAKLGSDPEITLLVNNAGIYANAKLAEHALKSIDDMVQLNIVALTHLASIAAKAFSARRKGTIINIASVLALAPEISNATYAGTKAYVLALTQAMKVELADAGVKVQAVLPGATRTEIWERSGGDINALPAEMVMEAGEMVDAALAGLDQGEVVTIPSLPDAADWKRFEEARAALGPNLSLQHAARRFNQARPAA